MIEIILISLIFSPILNTIPNQIIPLMGNSFFKYVQQLELFGFFSGYSLLYAIIIVFAGDKLSENNFKKRLISILPFSYALIGALFLGLQIKNFYESHLTGNFLQNIYNPFLTFWALLSILFWIPTISKRQFLSLLHNLVFFFLLLKDVIMQIISPMKDDILKNDMKIYTTSLLLNLGSFILLVLLSFIAWQNKKSSKY
jgi:hypothetical protein